MNWDCKGISIFQLSKSFWRIILKDRHGILKKLPGREIPPGDRLICGPAVLFPRPAGSYAHLKNKKRPGPCDRGALGVLPADAGLSKKTSTLTAEVKRLSSRIFPKPVLPGERNAICRSPVSSAKTYSVLPLSKPDFRKNRFRGLIV